MVRKLVCSEFMSQWIPHYWGLMSDLAKLSKYLRASLCPWVPVPRVSTFLCVFFTLYLLFSFLSGTLPSCLFESFHCFFFHRPSKRIGMLTEPLGLEQVFYSHLIIASTCKICTIQLFLCILTNGTAVPTQMKGAFFSALKMRGGNTECLSSG